MSDLIIPDSRFEMPSLFYPGRKPVGNVKINWSHPLTKGLVGCWIFQMNGSQISPISLNSESSITPNGLHCPSSGNEVTNGAVVGQDGDATDIVGDFSIVSKVRPTVPYTGDDYRAIISRRSAAGYQLHFRLKDAGVVSLLTSGGSVDAVETVPSGEWHEISVTSNPSGRDFYINKASESALFKSISHVSSATIIGSTEITNSYNLAFGGDISYVFLFNRKIGAVENSRLHASPYQFLIPA